MKIQIIRDEELVVGKQYPLKNIDMKMIISVASDGLTVKYGGLQMRFLVQVGTESFYVNEGMLFSPITGDSFFKITARKSGGDTGIKPNWIYFLIEYKVE